MAELSPDELQHRAIPEMWSIAEYVDHVREVLFGMRFVLDTAVVQPGTDLGDAPAPRRERYAPALASYLSWHGV